MPQNERKRASDQVLHFRLSLTAIVVIGFTYLSRHLQLDDALIYDRYVYNALHGLGLVYNAGEHVNALTSPAYSYILLAISWLLHGQIQLAAVLIFIVTYGAACMMAESLFQYSGIFLSTVACLLWTPWHGISGLSLFSDAFGHFICKRSICISAKRLGFITFDQDRRWGASPRYTLEPLSRTKTA